MAETPPFLPALQPCWASREPQTMATVCDEYRRFNGPAGSIPFVQVLLTDIKQYTAAPSDGRISLIHPAVLVPRRSAVGLR